MSVFQGVSKIGRGLTRSRNIYVIEKRLEAFEVINLNFSSKTDF
jgi:hypothetical protein